MRILIVEDDPSLAAVLKKRLTTEGYVVDACTNGTEGLAYARCAQYDAIILDIMLPGMDGLSVLRELRRAANQSGVLLLTARDGIQDRVVGLDAGADDYLVKPFAFEELMARLRTILRRQVVATPALMRLEDLTLDPSTHEVVRAGQSVSLSAKEYALLQYLFHNQGIVLTRAQILDHVWSNESMVESNVVDVYIRYLRNKIDRGAKVKLVHTVRGFGYVLRTDEVQG